MSFGTFYMQLPFALLTKTIPLQLFFLFYYYFRKKMCSSLSEKSEQGSFNVYRKQTLAFCIQNIHSF